MNCSDERQNPLSCKALNANGEGVRKQIRTVRTTAQDYAAKSFAICLIRGIFFGSCVRIAAVCKASRQEGRVASSGRACYSSELSAG